MNIEKLPSGSYRVTQMVGGKRYRFTFDHKPSKVEAMRVITESIEKKPTSVKNMTFQEAALSYIDSKSNILSPSTIREYKGFLRNITPEFLSLHMMQITTMNVQKFINDYSATRSAKTTANMAHFISAVLNSMDISIKPPQLPQREKKRPYIPTEDEVHAIFREVKGTKYEVPILLAANGLRRSEICALTLEDLNGTLLTINKALVQNENKEWVVKKTKTVESTRVIDIDQYIADLIREQGYVFVGDPGMIYKHLLKVQKKLGIPKFQLHKMRHFCVSYLHYCGFSDKNIQYVLGYSSDKTMKEVYRHEMEIEKEREEMGKRIGSLIG